MHVIKSTNVRDALLSAVHHLVLTGHVQPTRAGDAIVAPEPVTLVYRHPKQHVLLDPIRDANPFFHLLEAMWMLAGRQDGAFLDHYIKDFSKNYGVNGVILDSYGYRWRYGYKYDQLDEIINQLRRDPNTRQAVLAMWGAGSDDLRAMSGKPCNLSAVFSIRRGALNLTVFNRSNDLIWGACGANAVHFSILLEYMAGRLGLPIGFYSQVTNNLHMYVAEHDRLCRRSEGGQFVNSYRVARYSDTSPLMADHYNFSSELWHLMGFIDELHAGKLAQLRSNWYNPFLGWTVARMAIVHYLYKQGNMEDALDIANTIGAEDWRLAAVQWLERRKKEGAHDARTNLS
jgi:hypothetical protein